MRQAAQVLTFAQQPNAKRQRHPSGDHGTLFQITGLEHSKQRSAKDEVREACTQPWSMRTSNCTWKVVVAQQAVAPKSFGYLPP